MRFSTVLRVKPGSAKLLHVNYCQRLFFPVDVSSPPDVASGGYQFSKAQLTVLYHYLGIWVQR